jgi:hypothetical protein
MFLLFGDAEHRLVGQPGEDTTAREPGSWRRFGRSIVDKTGSPANLMVDSDWRDPERWASAPRSGLPH